MSDVLRKTRTEIKNSGAVPAETKGEEYLLQIMDLKKRMNEAKLAAMEAAAAPYLAELEAVETEYAMYLKLASQ